MYRSTFLYKGKKDEELTLRDLLTFDESEKNISGLDLSKATPEDKLAIEHLGKDFFENLQPYIKKYYRNSLKENIGFGSLSKKTLNNSKKKENE